MSTNTAAKEKKKWAFPLGIVIVVLAVIGLVTVIIFAVRGIGSLTDNSDKFEKYEQFLSPVIMNDPDPFDDVSGAQMSQLIDASIWSLMKSDIDIDQYEYAEGDVSGVIVPQKDVEKQFAKLFGTDVKPVHCTVDGGTYTFTYDEEAGLYRPAYRRYADIHSASHISAEEGRFDNPYRRLHQRRRLGAGRKGQLC